MQLVLGIEQVILEHADAGEAVDWFDPAARIVVGAVEPVPAFD
jgi:hypothetical protein